MKKTNSRLLIYCLVLCFISGSISYYLAVRHARRTCVVDAVKLFNEFNMKKELEGQAKKKLQGLSAQMDSVANKLKMAQATKEDSVSSRYTRVYNYLKANLDNEYTKSNDAINAEVWKRLNPLINEWGKKNNYHLVIGANGMGSILYTDEYYDKTDDLVKYVNKRYEEGN